MMDDTTADSEEGTEEEMDDAAPEDEDAEKWA